MAIQKDVEYIRERVDALYDDMSRVKNRLTSIETRLKIGGKLKSWFGHFACAVIGGVIVGVLNFFARLR